ncbi:hypothetical protein BVI434_370069 [Burkholderia vietnamiensis]|nr:hypothetical protein BVI434_370069 [Burkholderia vietnamiensis]
MEGDVLPAMIYTGRARAREWVLTLQRGSLTVLSRSSSDADRAGSSLQRWLGGPLCPALSFIQR